MEQSEDSADRGAMVSNHERLCLWRFARKDTSFAWRPIASCGEEGKGSACDGDTYPSRPRTTAAWMKVTEVKAQVHLELGTYMPSVSRLAAAVVESPSRWW